MIVIVKIYRRWANEKINFLLLYSLEINLQLSTTFYAWQQTCFHFFFLVFPFYIQSIIVIFLTVFILHLFIMFFPIWSSCIYFSYGPLSMKHIICRLKTTFLLSCPLSSSPATGVCPFPKSDGTL